MGDVPQKSDGDVLTAANWNTLRNEAVPYGSNNTLYEGTSTTMNSSFTCLPDSGTLGIYHFGVAKISGTPTVMKNNMAIIDNVSSGTIETIDGSNWGTCLIYHSKDNQGFNSSASVGSTAATDGDMASYSGTSVGSGVEGTPWSGDIGATVSADRIAAKWSYWSSDTTGGGNWFAVLEYSDNGSSWTTLGSYGAAVANTSETVIRNNYGTGSIRYARMRIKDGVNNISGRVYEFFVY